MSFFAPPQLESPDELDALIEETAGFPDLPWPEPLDELDALIEEARRRARRRRLIYAAVAGLAIAIGASLFAIFGGGGGGATGAARHGHGQPSARAQQVLQSTGTPLAPLRGRYVSNLSFVDAQHGWTLLVPSCVTGALSCPTTVNVVGTSDGGRSWTRLASLSTCITGVRTCSSGEGWSVKRLSLRAGVVLAGSDGSFMTTDGGHHWAPTRPAVEAATSLAGSVAALTDRGGGCPGACGVGLGRATVGARSFAPVRSFLNPSHGFGDTLAGSGRDLYALGFGHVTGGVVGGAYSHLAISRDAGRSWSLRGDPCRLPGRNEVDARQVAAAGRDVALLCVPRYGGSASIALSSDAGRTFTRLHPPLNDGWGAEIALDARGDLAIANGAIGGAGSWNYRLAVSLDRGRTWHVALKSRAPLPSAQRLPSLAIFGRSLRWVTGNRTLWRSDDAGATWQKTRLP